MIDLLDVFGVDVEKDSLATVIDKIGKSRMRSVKYIYRTGGGTHRTVFVLRRSCGRQTYQRGRGQDRRKN